MTAADGDAGWTSRGVRAVVVLHERNLLDFLEVWRRARKAELVLPATEDPDYASLAALLRHVCGAARAYLVGVCEALGRPIELPQAPPVEEIEQRVDDYLARVTAAWREHLATLDERTSEHHELRAPWGPTYCIEGYLEHGVVHPARHALQLEELLLATR